MRNFVRTGCIPLLSLLALVSLPARAETGISKQFKPFLTRGESSWSFGVGVRRNNFNWNIASDTTGTQTPNVLSELTWSDVTLLEVTGGVRHDEPMDIGFVTGDVHLEAQATVGMAISGDNQDSDYLGDNRTLEFSRSNNSASEGESIGGKIAAGYKIALTGDPTRNVMAMASARTPKTARERALRMQKYRQALRNAGPSVSVTPLVGYGWDQQTYRMSDGYQTIDTLTNELGPFGGLDSQYTADWYGPFIGAELEVAGKKNQVQLRGEYSDLTYNAKAVWNMRSTFRQDPSYVHEADGSGLLLNAEYAYAWSDDYALTLDGMYQKRSAEDGIDKVFLNTGAGTVVTRLNEVNDESYALRLGVRRDW